MENTPAQQPNAALLAMHEADRERGINPLAPTLVVVVPSTKPPITEFTGFPKPDWAAVIRAEKAAERAARITEASELLESTAPPRQPDPPAAKAGRWRRASP